jgi:predicted GIY-YIG superfamily endonuclease
MYYVYILKSKSQPGVIYKGYSGNLKKRLGQHNDSNNRGYSKLYCPWEIELYLGFKSKEKAKHFEKYLKSSSGNAFMNKHLLSEDLKRALTKFKKNRRGKHSAA